MTPEDQEVDCECGSFTVYGTFEERRDLILEHLMLTHGVTEWVERNVPGEEDDI